MRNFEFKPSQALPEQAQTPKPSLPSARLCSSGQCGLQKKPPRFGIVSSPSSDPSPMAAPGPKTLPSPRSSGEGELWAVGPAPAAADAHPCPRASPSHPHAIPYPTLPHPLPTVSGSRAGLGTGLGCSPELPAPGSWPWAAGRCPRWGS